MLEKRLVKDTEYDIRILPVEIVPANFNSAEAMWQMVQRLREG